MGNTFFRDKHLTDTYRGANLESLGKTISSVAAQVRNGDFSDLYVGDYFDTRINNRSIKWHIADIDYFLNTGDILLKKHHLVMMNDIPIYSTFMAPFDSTQGGYAGSDIRKNRFDEIINMIDNEGFGSYILTHRELLSNSLDPNAKPSGCTAWVGCTNGWEWCDSTIELLTEPQVYGCTIASSSTYDVGIGTRQFAIFRLNNTFMNIGVTWWLRAVSSGYTYCVVSGEGVAGARNTSDENGGVKVYFLLG